MSGDLEEDPWGEEPDWAREDDDGEGDTAHQETGEGSTFPFGAQHVLVLLDCSHSSMFVPCIQQSQSIKRKKEESQSPLDHSFSEDIFHPNKNSSSSESLLMSPFDAALNACEKLLRLRVNHVATSKSGKRDGVGVLLYGISRKTESSPSSSSAATAAVHNKAGSMENDSGDDHSEDDENDDDDDDDSMVGSLLTPSTYELIGLAPPGTQQVLECGRCLALHENNSRRRKRDLKQEFANHEPTNDDSSPSSSLRCPLRSALHDASKAFFNAKCVKKQAASTKYPADLKTIWIFTNNDDPCHGNEEEQKQIMIVAKDAVENGIELRVWPLPSADGSHFDGHKFFHKITTVDDTERFSSGAAVFDLDSMLDEIGQQWKKARRIFSIPILFPGWKERPSDNGIMVDFFRTIQVQRKPTAVTVHQKTNKMTVKSTQILALDSGEIVPKDRLQYFAEFGGARVPITKEEMARLKRESNVNDKFASLVLIGFQPDTVIPLTHTLEPCYFIYPNEDRMKGSRAAFSALHASMIRKGVLAIGELLSRITGTSRLVAMIPQQEEVEAPEHDDGGAPKQLKPPGFLVYPLPYEDDVRALEKDAIISADEDTVHAAVKVIQNQQMGGIEFGYSFENPALTRFWNYIESVALGTRLPEEDDEEGIDETKMDVNGILAAAGPQIEEFKACLPDDDIPALTGTRKRKAIKQEGDTELDWLDLYESDSLVNCTSDTLKLYLRSIGAKLGGKKADLVERVKEDIEEKLASGELGRSKSRPTNVKKEEDV